MSYYDHAVMITYRLGPWAETGRSDHREVRRPPRRKPFSALFKWIGQAFRRLRGTRVTPDTSDAHSQTEAGDCKPLHHA